MKYAEVSEKQQQQTNSKEIEDPLAPTKAEVGAGYRIRLANF